MSPRSILGVSYGGVFPAPATVAGLAYRGVGATSGMDLQGFENSTLWTLDILARGTAFEALHPTVRGCLMSLAAGRETVP